MSQLAVLRRQIEAARRASRFSPDRIATSTKLPGGAALHKALSRLFLRQAHGILLQVQEFADRTLEALDAVVALADSPDGHRHVEVIEQLDAHSERLAALEVAALAVSPAAQPGADVGPGVDPVDDVARRLERLETADAARRWRPWFGRARFDAAFDSGPPLAIAQHVGDRAPVLAVAVDGPLSALAALVATPDQSLGAVVAVGADDLLTAQQMVDLVALAFERLAPDGLLLVSCAPASQPRFDPTLGPPLPARYVAFACHEAGFASVDVENGPDDSYLVVATR